jgi:glycosyltransferase involved in cell wall biosynthesis
MRICHLTSVHQQEDTRILYKECHSLAKAGNTVYLVSYGKTYDKFGVHLVGLENKPTNRFARITKGAGEIVKKGLELNADVYHLHDPELLPFIPKLKRAGKRVIFDSHEDIPQQILEKKWLLARKIVSKIYIQLEKHYLRQADAIISVTPHIIERLEKINPNTVMITNYPILDEVIVTERESKEEDYLCFAGRISSDWNHEEIIESLQEINGVRYVLCGKPDTEQYFARLKAKDKKGILDFRGMVSHSQVRDLYRNALAGVSWLSPSQNVGGDLGTLGNNKLFEQMAAGIPVIISNLHLWKNIIETWKCGIVVNNGDIEGFKTAVNKLLAEPDKRREMGINGRQAVCESYNWQQEEKKLLALYQQL